MAKRKKTYEPKITLKESVQWDDLINVTLKPIDHEKKIEVKRKGSVSKRE